MTAERYIMLKHDPLAVFPKIRTPAGLYARSHWMGHGHDLSCQIDFKKKIAALREEQLRNGSWAGSPLLTAGRLFDCT